jgi:hypothetical protein
MAKATRDDEAVDLLDEALKREMETLRRGREARDAPTNEGAKQLSS